MKEEKIWLTMDDGHQLFAVKWYSEHVQPKAVLQISHGMAEHIYRYRDFAESLVNEGYVIIGNDHRGHGKTAEKNGILGYISEEKGFDRAVEDLHLVNQFIRKEYQTLPVFMLGHSMGSFLVRRFIQCYDSRVDGVILSGTGGSQGILGKAGSVLAKLQVKKLGNRTESPFMNTLFFGGYNKKIPNRKTKFDWLSKDNEVVQRYNDDPHCGFIATAGFYYDLLKGLELIHKNEEIKKINKTLPLLFISGEDDPVGRYTKGVKAAINQYKKQGMTNIESIFYPKGRHEMINETNRDQVINDIVQWLNKKAKDVKV